MLPTPYPARCRLRTRPTFPRSSRPVSAQRPPGRIVPLDRIAKVQRLQVDAGGHRRRGWLVVPTLLTWSGSAIVHDIKGENWTLTAGWRARFGRVLLFDPTNAASAGGRRQHGEPKSDRCGSNTSAGWKRQHGDEDMPSNWRSPPRPEEKSSEQGRSYNRLNREIDRRREGDGWVRSSVEAG